MSAHRRLPRALAGELLGTYLLVLFGTGSVAAAVLTNAQMGLWQVAVVWGFGVTLAIYASATLSGAHLNPAVSLAFALSDAMTSRSSGSFPYILAQLVGAMLASATVAWLFWPFLVRFEATKGLIRGAPGSDCSAMVFGEYLPESCHVRYRGGGAGARLALACRLCRGVWDGRAGVGDFRADGPTEPGRPDREPGALLHRLYRGGAD